MGLWSKILNARNAINYGEQLANSATWKKQAIAVGAITGLLTAVLPFIPGLADVTPETIDSISRGVFGVYTVYNVYIHAATTKSVGLRSSNKD